MTTPNVLDGHRSQRTEEPNAGETDAPKHLRHGEDQDLLHGHPVPSFPPAPRRRRSLEVHDLDARHPLCQPFGHQATMTSVWSWLRAQQARPLVAVQEIPSHSEGVALLQECQERRLIPLPIGCLSVAVEEFRAGGKLRSMLVADAKTLAKQEGEILLLGEPRQLGSVAEPDINHGVDCGRLEQPDELLQRFLSGADRADRRHVRVDVAE